MNHQLNIIQLANNITSEIIVNTSNHKINHNNQSKKTFTRKPSNPYLLHNRKKTEDPTNYNLLTESQCPQKAAHALQRCKTMKFITSSKQPQRYLDISSQLSFHSLNNQISLLNRSNSCLLPVEMILNQSIYQMEIQEERKEKLISNGNNRNYEIINDSQKQYHQKKQTEYINTNNKISSILMVDKKKKVEFYQAQDTKIIINYQPTQKQLKDLDKDNKNLSTEISSILQSSSSSLNDDNNIDNSTMIRKSSSGNLFKDNLIVKKGEKQCKNCNQIELFYKRQVKDYKMKIEKLERIIMNKDREIEKVNEKGKAAQSRFVQVERKLKSLEGLEHNEKISKLQQALSNSQKQCNKLRESYVKTLQELKIKNSENLSLKKFESQFVELQRKYQLLVSERSDLKQKIHSNIKVETFTSPSRYTAYPSALTRARSSKTIIRPDFQSKLYNNEPRCEVSDFESTGAEQSQIQVLNSVSSKNFKRKNMNPGSTISRQMETINLSNGKGKTKTLKI